MEELTPSNSEMMGSNPAGRGTVICRIYILSPCDPCGGATLQIFLRLIDWLLCSRQNLVSKKDLIIFLALNIVDKGEKFYS